MRISIVTGSAGLIGSQACDFFSSKGYKVVGIDNDMRSYFFGPSSSTKDSLASIKSKIKKYEHYEIDIRDYNKINDLFRKYSKKIDVVIHTAAQPSHDWPVLWQRSHNDPSWGCSGQKITRLSRVG